MGSSLTEIVIILVLILLNGVLAMSEISVVSARKARLQQRAEEGDSGAAAALELANSPGRFLSTVQIGITLVGIFAGAFGGATIARPLGDNLAQIPVLEPYSDAISVAAVVLLITYLNLVLGELAPKQIGLNNSEKIASRVAPLMKVLARIAGPVVSFLTFSTDLILRLLGIRQSNEPAVTEEEVRILIAQGAETGVFEPIEQEMVRHVFRLSDRRVNSLMTPRPEIIWLDIEDTPEEIRNNVIVSDHSQLPVAAGDLDHLLGYVRVTDLMVQCVEGRPMDIQSALQPALFIPESMPAFDVLEKFKETGSQIAFAIDEYGGIQGLVTLRDILEAIVGDIPEADEEEDPDIVQREDGSWLLDGMLPIDEFRELFDLEELPGEEEHYYQTLGGFVMTMLGRIPSPSDNFEWGDLRIEVLDMDGNRIDKLLVARGPEAGD